MSSRLATDHTCLLADEAQKQGSVITVGSFDGLHVGHRLLVQRTLDLARQKGFRSVVVTFRPHPAKVLAPAFSPPLLMAYDRKAKALADLGVELILEQEFSREFASLGAEEFVKRVLVEALGARILVVGDDFTFGRKREGTVEMLSEMGQRHGFAVEVVKRIAVEGMVVSSTRVRSFLLQGKVRGAALLLGRPFSIIGRVVTGQGRGRKLGFPTANLESDAEILPAYGVYVSQACLLPERRVFPAVTNVGVCPTFGETVPTVEAHLLEDPGDIVGREMALAFVHRLRGEIRFSDVADLIHQIGIDAAAARDSLAAMPRPAFPGPLDGV